MARYSWLISWALLVSRSFLGIVGQSPTNTSASARLVMTNVGSLGQGSLEQDLIQHGLLKPAEIPSIAPWRSPKPSLSQHLGAPCEIPRATRRAPNPAWWLYLTVGHFHMAVCPSLTLMQLRYEQIGWYDAAVHPVLTISGSQTQTACLQSGNPQFEVEQSCMMNPHFDMLQLFQLSQLSTEEFTLGRSW